MVDEHAALLVAGQLTRMKTIVSRSPKSDDNIYDKADTCILYVYIDFSDLLKF